jgi:membrane protease YdiL (CAAX protease family)
MKNLRATLKKNPIISFFVVTYVISWAFWLPQIFTGSQPLLEKLGTFGPTCTAILLTALLEGRSGLSQLWQKLKTWKFPFKWYLFSLLSTAVIVWSAIGIYTAFGGIGLVFNDPKQWYLGIIAFLYVLILSVTGEEFGWRGFALPRLLGKKNALTSGIIIGLIWGLWHLPLFFIPGNFHQEIPLILFLLQDIALSIIMTWLYQNTQGSLLIALLFHAASNTTLGLFPVLPMDTGGSLVPLWISFGLLWLLTIGIVLINGVHLKGKLRSHSSIAKS